MLVRRGNFQLFDTELDNVGDWATRQRLVALPECALTTPGAAGCRVTALPSRNDTGAGRVSAEVAAGREDRRAVAQRRPQRRDGDA